MWLQASTSSACRFGEQIRQRRVQLKMNQSELAERADVARNTVYRIEAGQPGCKMSYLLRVLQALGVSANDLFCAPIQEQELADLARLWHTCRRRKRFCSIQPPKRWPKQCCVCRRSARRSVHEPLFLNCTLQGAKLHKMHLVSCCVLPKMQVQYNQGINNPVRQDGFGVLAGCTLKSK